MPLAVLLTEDAAHDLEELYNYIELHDVPGKADYVLGKIEGILETLAESPRRGAYPEELLALGIREYREVFFTAYRIAYRTIDDMVYVLLIADGWRDMQALLQRRLLGA